MLIKITFHFILFPPHSSIQSPSHIYVISVQITQTHKQLKEDLPRVWLLLYDLYLRTFSKRKPELLPLKDKLFKESEMLCKFFSRLPSGKLRKGKKHGEFK